MEGSNIFLLVVQPYLYGFFYQTLSALSLISFVPGGVSQVLRKETESVLSHNSAVHFVYIHALRVKLIIFW